MRSGKKSEKNEASVRSVRSVKRSEKASINKIGVEEEQINTSVVNKQNSVRKLQEQVDKRAEEVEMAFEDKSDEDNGNFKAKDIIMISDHKNSDRSKTSKKSLKGLDK